MNIVDIMSEFTKETCEDCSLNIDNGNAKITFQTGFQQKYIFFSHKTKDSSTVAVSSGSPSTICVDFGINQTTVIVVRNVEIDDESNIIVTDST